MTKHCCESDCVGCETYAKIKEAYSDEYFVSESDTEVILKHYDKRGVPSDLDDHD